MNKIKKIVAVLAIVGMFGVAAPSANALTADELMAQIQALQTQLNTLMSQYQTLTGTTSTSAPAACSGVTFTANLAEGSSGSAVQCLQALLNSDVATQVAVSGVGSSGAETTYFGSLTKAAAVKFQEKYAAEILTPLGLSAGTGFVGASTRAKLNSMVSTGVPSTPGTTPTTPLSGTTEGTLTVTADATPPSAQTIYAGQEKVAIAGLKVKALGSDIRVDRLDINFTARPWLNVSTITIADAGTDIIAYDVTSANTIEVTAGSSYLVRLTGLNIVIPDGVTKVLTVKVNPKLVAGTGTTDSGALTYQILANAVRGTDGVAIVQYAPSTALTARTFTVSSSAGALALSVNSGNPAARAVIGSATAATENVELLRIDLKATINDVIVSKIVGTLTDGTSVLQTLKLYDGDTLLAATSTSGSASSTFDALNIRVAKDTTKTLSIKGDVKILTEALMNKAVSIAVPATVDGITAADAGTFGTVPASGSTVTGKTVYAYTAAPSLSLVSAEIATTREGRTDGSNTISAIGKIKFNVTALGGNIYVDTPTAGAVATSTNATAGVATTITSTGSSNAEVDGNEWLVREGESKWFEVTSRITNSSPSASFVNMNLASFAWGTTSATVTGVDWAWASIPLEFKTGSVYLQGTN